MIQKAKETSRNDINRRQVAEEYVIYDKTYSVEEAVLDTYIQYNTIQYNTIQYNTIQYTTLQYNTIQYNTIQYNTHTHVYIHISIYIYTHKYRHVYEQVQAFSHIVTNGYSVPLHAYPKNIKKYSELTCSFAAFTMLSLVT